MRRERTVMINRPANNEITLSIERNRVNALLIMRASCNFHANAAAGYRLGDGHVIKHTISAAIPVICTANRCRDAAKIIRKADLVEVARCGHIRIPAIVGCNKLIHLVDRLQAIGDVTWTSIRVLV